MIVVQTKQVKNSTRLRYTSDFHWLTTYKVTSAEYTLRGKMVDCAGFNLVRGPGPRVYSLS